ncbi:MAG TPA: DUF308 domain-containing protein [Pseudosphingobacterium sp.]|nr:DUF308 domain-containing protein [Pseudosphingobacterium sp.]
METIIKKSFRHSFFNRQLLVTGLLLIVIGCLTIWRPFQSYLFISLAFSILIIISGVLEIVFAVKHKKTVEAWGYTLIDGLIDVAMGSYLLLSPLLMMIVLTPLISIWVFYKGFLSVRLAFMFQRYIYTRWWLQLIIGICVMLISLLIVGNATVGFINIISWTGLGISLIGVSSVLLSFVHWSKNVEAKLDEYQ